MELLGLMYAGEETETTLSAGARTLRDTPRVVAAMCELLAEPDRRQQLHSVIERLMSRSDEMLGRWAGVMLNSAASPRSSIATSSCTVVWPRSAAFSSTWSRPTMTPGAGV